MKLAELKEMPKSTPLFLSKGNGWYEKVDFIRLVKTTSFGRMTFTDFMNNGIDMSKGREQWEAMVTDAKGEIKIVSPRRLSVYY